MDRSEAWQGVVRGLPEDSGESLRLFPIEAKLAGKWRQTVVLNLAKAGDDARLEVAVPDEGSLPPMPGIRGQVVGVEETRPIEQMQEKMYEFLQALLIAEVSRPLRGEDKEGKGWAATVAAELPAWAEEFDYGLLGNKVLGSEHDVVARVVAALRQRQEEYGEFYSLAILGEEGEEWGEPVLIFTDLPLEGRVRLNQEYLVGRSQGGIGLSREPGKRLWPVGLDREWTGAYLMPAWIGHLARFDAILEAVGEKPGVRAGQPIMQWMLREFAEAGKEWDELAETGVEIPKIRRQWVPASLWGLSEGGAKL